jgi:hypothetical protein
MTSTNAQPDILAPKLNNRQRGPVEEVIAKRMRQLGKKLVRNPKFREFQESRLMRYE